MKQFLDPVCVFWLLIVCVALLAYRKQLKRLATGLILIALTMNLVAFFRLPARLLAGLEAPYALKTSLSGDEVITNFPMLRLAGPADAVVECGGSFSDSPCSYFGGNVIESGDRLLTSIELVRKGHAKNLVIGASLPGTKQGFSGGEIGRRWIRNWDLLPEPVYDLGLCANTREESLAAAALAKKHQWKKIILVTSAWHLRRAEATFRKAGLDVTPVGCDFVGMSSMGKSQRSFFLGSNDLIKFNYWLTEIVGYWAYSLRGWA